MDVKMINPFINATLNVLETMAFVKAEAGKPYLKKNDVAQGDVSGVVGFTGEANGTVYVTFDEECILKIVSNMFGEEMTEINNEITDAVGELTNMISGQARKEIAEIGKVFHGAIPTVVTGKNHKVISMVKGPKIAIPFKTDAGSFTIEVCIENKS
ncbi:MAG: chemotaxis protein CheX [Pseudomonadota bacterium]|uniref:Chemotaxis protein CheX n=1 Tax=Candidatus Desulfatibia profunda TaxID=2841695 RepID=A0A8J6NS24_9BACT|nr:chemotaxis protein CheX [Candidatus Desulfatibia profunda]MBL7180443.1 chemotaxis protein CheX [Desulfobacterales bacterium]MBU0698301.1 chemotaxis protein CheX [Pseudomonadota bacterium]